MRHTVTLFFGLLIIGFSAIHALAINEVKPSQATGGEWTQEHTSLSGYLAALEAYQTQTTEMKKRMQFHASRLGQSANTPHMDPRGFQRFASNMMFNFLRNQMEKIEQRIAWHYEQMRQLQA